MTTLNARVTTNVVLRRREIDMRRPKHSQKHLDWERYFEGCRSRGKLGLMQDIVAGELRQNVTVLSKVAE